jgi:CII-binding regulator of phage lambda lysogenization HflD
VSNGQETHSYRLIRLERDMEEDRRAVKELSDRIDKLTLAVVGFALTLAVFGLGIAVTLLTTRTG